MGPLGKRRGLEIVFFFPARLDLGLGVIGFSAVQGKGFTVQVLPTRTVQGLAFRLAMRRSGGNKE